MGMDWVSLRVTLQLTTALLIAVIYFITGVINHSLLK